jgi:hypothetical protein
VRRILLPLAACAALATSASAAALPAPESFVRQVNQQLYSGQVDRVYNALHPLQQKLVSRQLFDRCMRAKQLPGVTLTGAKLIKSLRAKSLIPGTGVKTQGLKVTVQLTGEAGGPSDTQTVTMQLFTVKGAWRWSLNGAEIRAYRLKQCPPPSS